MSLLDSVLGQVTGGDKNAQLISLVMKLLTDQKGGGLAGMLQQFDAGGLGDLASSWVGSGQNKSVSGGQVASALGPSQISAIASQLGMSSDDVTGKLATLLPGIIDKLTPDGNVPKELPKADGIEGLLKGLLG